MSTRMTRRRYDSNGLMQFTLTEDHRKLMRRMYVEWDDAAYEGSPAVGLKRPYGNSDVVGDVCEILGWGELYDEDTDEYDEDLAERARKIHRETEYAVAILLATGQDAPGDYATTRMYDDSSWAKVSPVHR